MKEKAIKAYELWQGSHKFLFKGHLVLGPNYNRAIVTFLLILLAEIVFISTISMNFSPWVAGLSIFLATLSIFFLLIIATSDPGFIPKQEFPFARGPLRAPTIYSSLINEPTKPAAIEKLYFERCYNGSRIRLKYCRSCWILRPPRTSHCADCNVCVQEYDHHCPWVGTCIGKNNYWTFLLFLYTLLCLIVFNFYFCLYDLIRKISTSNRNSVLENAGPSIFLGMFIFCFLIFVTGLGTFHCFLVCKGISTAEALKKISHFKENNPYERSGLLQQLVKIITQRTFQSYNFQETFVQGDKNFCNVCPSELAIRKAGNITDFEVTVNQETYNKKSNSVLVTPTEEVFNKYSN